MANIRGTFAMPVVNVTGGLDMWEKIDKVYPHSKRRTHYEEEKLNVNLWRVRIK